MDEAGTWIERLGLVPHPEGGFFREVYRSADLISPACLPRLSGPRCLATSIYYLLRGGQVSNFHRLRSDEVWHFYAGGGLTIAVIGPEGALEEIRLGPDRPAGEVFQAVVPAGRWFGAFVTGTSAFALAGCTLSPGFDHGDFELGRRADLLRQYPRHREMIVRLTR